ncbi:hypothetical protein GCM10011506_42830 [Marivirga lumbricoides]|uniref:DUF4377 domain-containing protein n=1 Tax=Marivirga lumbricoides TaxID=1046115 RepID=A0ABQ1N469_9BACT|nr:hypothetical protein GCM10011506_42830 [Marivirga lumbricoides]
MKKRNYLFLFSILLAVLSACESATVEPNSNRLGFQFFPLSLSQSNIFEVEEINYRNDGTVDTFYYQLEDVWVDSLASDNQIRLQGYRYKVSRDGSREILSTIEKFRTPHIAVEKLGNEQEVKLSFPVRESLQWNAAPAEQEADTYTLFKVFQPYTLEDSVFDRTVQVIQEDNGDSVIAYDQRIEVYAEDVGLIYKISSQLEFCNETECLGLKQIDFGQTVKLSRKF